MHHKNSFKYIDFDRDNSLNHFVNKEAIYVKSENRSFSAHKTVFLDFYSQDDQVDSVYSESFLDELYRIHGSACMLAEDDRFIYSTIIGFLGSINPYDMLNINEKDKKLTQLALILSAKYWDEDFINDALRPAFIQAEWISASDGNNKIIFSNELQCRMIYLQNKKKVLTWNTNNSLLRERKYISCSIQCIPHKAKILLSLDIFQMQYNTNFVKLCASDRSQLKVAVFSPTIVGSTATIEVPIPSLTAGENAYLDLE